MPNKPISNMPSRSPAVRVRSEGNGWLSYVLAEYLGNPVQLFGRASADAVSPRFYDADVPGLGPVRIRYEVFSYKHRRNTLWAWRATRADKISELSDGPPNRAMEPKNLAKAIRRPHNPRTGNGPACSGCRPPHNGTSLHPWHALNAA